MNLGWRDGIKGCIGGKAGINEAAYGMGVPLAHEAYEGGWEGLG